MATNYQNNPTPPVTALIKGFNLETLLPTVSVTLTLPEKQLK